MRALCIHPLSQHGVGNIYRHGVGGGLYISTKAFGDAQN